MARCVVLLRAVNVGGHNRVPMKEFAALLEGLGCREVTTLLQSGNAVVTASARGLAGKVEAALRDQLAVDVRVLVRTGAQLAAVVAANPFPKQVATPKLLHVAFLDGRPDTAKLAKLGEKHGADEIRAGEACYYLAYGDSSNDSPLGKVLRQLGGVATARNWSTVTKLVELAAT